MIFHPADDVSLWIFSAFALLMAVLCLFAVKRTGYKFKKFSVIFGLYLAGFSGLVAAGLPQKHVLPFFPLMFASVLILSLWFAFSEYGKRVSQVFSLATLIGLQGFRLPLELILHHWADLQTVPETMTWTGQNWDIVAGVASLLAIPFVNASRRLAWGVNMLGFVLLLNVLRVVIMSSPFPFSWPLENPIQLIAYMPYALIGPLFVGVAFAGHLIVFRKLSAH